MRKAMYLMGVLDDSDIEWMADRGTVRTVTPGTVLLQEGRQTDHLFLVLDGQLSVTVGGKEIARLLSGEVVGEISFVDSRPPSASVTATEKSNVFAIPRADLQQKLNRDMKFASHFYRALSVFLAERLRITTGRLGYGDPRQDSEANDLDEMSDDLMESTSLAMVRFDALLKRLHVH